MDEPNNNILDVMHMNDLSTESLRKAGFFFLFLFSLLPMGQAASFDCAKAATPIERAVCSSPKLSALDEELDQLYRHELNRTPDVPGARDEIRSGQRAWLRSNRNSCADVACLEAAYSQRIAALKAAKTLYDNAKADAEQEERNPPPEADTNKTAASASASAGTVTAQAAAASGLAPAVEPAVAPPQAAAGPASAAAAQAPVTVSSPQGKAASDADAKEPGMGALSMTFFGLALVLPIVVLWVTYKLARKTRGIPSSLALSSLAAIVTFIVFALVGTTTTTREYDAWLSAKGDREQKAAQMSKDSAPAAAAQTSPAPPSPGQLQAGASSQVSVVPAALTEKQVTVGCMAFYTATLVDFSKSVTEKGENPDAAMKRSVADTNRLGDTKDTTNYSRALHAYLSNYMLSMDSERLGQLAEFFKSTGFPDSLVRSLQQRCRSHVTSGGKAGTLNFIADLQAEKPTIPAVRFCEFLGDVSMKRLEAWRMAGLEAAIVSKGSIKPMYERVTSTTEGLDVMIDVEAQNWKDPEQISSQMKRFYRTIDNDPAFYFQKVQSEGTRRFSEWLNGACMQGAARSGYR